MNTVQTGIAAYTVEGCDQRAVFSMNEQSVERLEVNNGNGVQETPIDRDKPFALVLPVNAGEVTFYNVDADPLASVTEPW